MHLPETLVNFPEGVFYLSFVRDVHVPEFRQAAVCRNVSDDLAAFVIPDVSMLVACPMPRAAPVTMITLFSTLFMIVPFSKSQSDLNGR
jgi:glycerol-3-phosphate O-acyltransferase